MIAFAQNHTENTVTKLEGFRILNDDYTKKHLYTLSPPIFLSVTYPAKQQLQAYEKHINYIYDK